MEKYRSASTFGGVAMSHETDAAAWKSFLETSPAFVHRSLPANSPLAVQPAYQQHPASSQLQDGRRGSMSHPNATASNFDPNFNTIFSDGAAPQNSAPHGQNQSRPTTPSQQPFQSRKRAAPTSRPSSRASNRGGRPSLKQSQSCASRVELNTAETSEAEDGSRPKRARITKADWNGSSNFGATGESLRVTAATTASIRGHRPLVGNPLTSDIAAELGERPPTPRPGKAGPPKPIPVFPRSLTDRPQQTTVQHAAYQPSHDNDPLGILADSSPEKHDQSSDASTPMDLPSSPPVMRDASPTPSPPVLARQPKFHDSGFASGNLDEYLSEAGDIKIEPQPLDGHMTILQSDIPSESIPAPEMNVGGRRLLPGPPPPGSLQAQAKDAASNAAKRKRAPKSRTQSVSRGPSQVKLDNSSIPASDQPDATLLSAAISAEDARLRSESCITDAGSVDGTSQPATKRAKTIMHEKKKQAIQVRLAESIQAGIMPRFCRNCGEISTPSWRKAFTKIEQGSPDHVRVMKEGEKGNGVLSWDVVEKDSDDKVTSYRLIKTSLAPEDTDFEEISLCNPCGIWLFRYKVMRPAENWQKEPPKPRRRSSAKKKKDGEPEMPESDTQAQSIEQDAGDDVPCSSDASQSRLPRRPGPSARLQRSNSVGPMNQPKRYPLGKASAKSALQRAIQSSPPRFPGSKHSPIEIDLDANLSPQPTKRLLFPSPRKPGQTKSLDPTVDKRVERDAEGEAKLSQGRAQDIPEDKENVPPTDNDSDDGFDHLFNDNSINLTTPKQKRQTTDLLKTPSRSVRRTPLAGKGCTPANGHLRRHSNPETPSRSNAVLLAAQQMTPFTAQLTALLSEANQGDDMTANFGGFDTHAMDDSGMFDFSDFGAGNSNSRYDMYEDPMQEGFWTGSEAFDAFLNEEPDQDMEQISTQAESNKT